MRIAGKYSLSGAEEIIEAKFPAELREIQEVIAWIDGPRHRTKLSANSFNTAFRKAFNTRNWQAQRIICNPTTQFYASGDSPDVEDEYRELDLVKNRVGLEIDFDKLFNMVYSGCALMTIFRNLGIIDAGVEIVPVREFAKDMSTGVSYFEQFVWDLEHRGVADIDIPVLILGVTG